MKKNLILLPLLTLMLSACSGLNFPSNNQNSQETPLKEPSSRNIVDAAVKVLNLVTIFVDEGAAIDLNEYIELDDRYAFGGRRQKAIWKKQNIYQ